MAAFRKLVIGSKALAFITLVSGAFVAGLDAGLVYNSFPKFADRWIPEDILAFSPALRNITENPTTVQFNHRILGTSTLAALLLVATRAQSLPLPPHLKMTALALGGMGCLQVAMGITTLLLYVPVPVAAAHQSGALVSRPDTVKYLLNDNGLFSGHPLTSHVGSSRNEISQAGEAHTQVNLSINWTKSS